MITLPRGRTLRLLTGTVLVAITLVSLYNSLSAQDSEYGFPNGIAEKAYLNRILHQPGSPYTRADVAFAQRAGITLVAVDSVANNSDTLGTPRVRGVIVMLARNEDLDGAKNSIEQLEKRFNHKYHYPYVYLNDEPFSEDFKTTMRGISPESDIQFGFIPKEHWSYPDWINQTVAKKARLEMAAKDVIYGGSESYRHMCRFNSGFFFRHPLLDQYDYYWRVEPSVAFLCDIPDDPFRYLQENNKLYGFTVSLYEFSETIPTLWKTVRQFINEHPSFVRKDNAMRWLGNKPDEYNLCHFWSNFEIASLHLWRSRAYLEFFNYLDKAGGFFYERWGDAPVHSIAVAMLLKPEQIHFFNEIGYYHNPIMHCPVDQPAMAGRCQCDGSETFDLHDYSCTGRWFDLFGGGEASRRAFKLRQERERAERSKQS
ncbi:hypothetical protein SpCBS45565_g05174 [Spizellomyces sp. 'palustris']|nr:hypothetical protein SpCBS45565_g05174 [Spizellomyces sp. 'palustris']